jgi:hypothetical protein
MPRPSGWGGIGLLRSRAGKGGSPSGRFDVCHGGVALDLQAVDDLGVEGPVGGLGLCGQPLVEVCGQSERDALLFIHDSRLVAFGWPMSGRMTP